MLAGNMVRGCYSEEVAAALFGVVLDAGDVRSGRGGERTAARKQIGIVLESLAPPSAMFGPKHRVLFFNEYLSRKPQRSASTDPSISVSWPLVFQKGFNSISDPGRIQVVSGDVLAAPVYTDEQPILVQLRQPLIAKLFPRYFHRLEAGIVRGHFLDPLDSRSRRPEGL